MGDFDLVNELAILIGARRPQWEVQLDAGGYPNGSPNPGSGVGVFLQNSPKTLVVVAIREESHRRTGRFTITFDAATTYTIDIEADSVPTVANADIATTIADMAANITADVPGAGDRVTATATESVVGGGVDTLLIQGKDDDDYIVQTTVAGGAGTLAAVLDPDGALVRTWFTGRNPNARTDYMLSNGGVYAVDKRGFVDRLDTSGLDRIYVELAPTEPGDTANASTTITYRNPEVLVGPSVRGAGE